MYWIEWVSICYYAVKAKTLAEEKVKWGFTITSDIFQTMTEGLMENFTQLAKDNLYRCESRGVVSIQLWGITPRWAIRCESHTQTQAVGVGVGMGSPLWLTVSPGLSRRCNFQRPHSHQQHFHPQVSMCFTKRQSNSFSFETLRSTS